MTQQTEKSKKQPPNEKPISLHPLTLEQALRKAMNAKPEPKQKPKNHDE